MDFHIASLIVKITEFISENSESVNLQQFKADFKEILKIIFKSKPIWLTEFRYKVENVRKAVWIATESEQGILDLINFDDID